MKNRIFYHLSDSLGWDPVSRMVEIGQRVFNAQLTDMAGSKLSLVRRIHVATIAPPRGGQGGDLFIARRPHELMNIFGHPAFLEKRAFRALWIIDSCFTDELIKPIRQLLANFDLVGFTQFEDREYYHSVCGDRAVHLGWGSDVLSMYQKRFERTIDLLRVGRQPSEWEDDDLTASACELLSIKFHGRPPSSNPLHSYQELMENWYSRSKIVVAHSNLAEPVSYGHPTKEYITARWTDSLACGAIIAGVQPKRDTQLIEWPGALIEFDRIDLHKNLAQIGQALNEWTPDIAINNRLQALRKLDWRWRFSEIAYRLNIESPALENEIQQIKDLIPETIAA